MQNCLCKKNDILVCTINLIGNQRHTQHLPVHKSDHGTDARCIGGIFGCFLSGVIVAAIAYLWGDGLLRLIGATDANLQMAHDYGVIIFAMMPLAMTQNALASIIRADGSPQYAMAAMLTGAVINIIGDPVAIFVLDMGIQGAAWATILGQFVSFLICAAYLGRSKNFRIKGSSFKPSAALLKPVMALGTSSLLTQLSIVIITVVNNILLVKYGARSIYGADIPLAAFVVLCLRVYLALIVVTCAQKVCAIFLQSIGKAKAAAPLSVLRDALLILFSLLLPAVFGVTGIFWAAPVADILAILVTVWLMVRVWKGLGQTAKTSKPAAVIQPSRKGMIITIAREHGSAGKRIGQLVAQRLGIPCYYKELVAIAAQESGLAQEFISNINSDENAVMRELYLTTDPIQRAIAAQDRAIRHIVKAGSCVIIGRSADYVLRNYPGVVRIFIHAPRSYREKSVSGQEWGDPHGYELCIDASMGEAVTADMICAYIDRLEEK